MYYFNDKCAFDPRAVVYDPCFWEAAGIPGFIRDLSPRSDQNWITDIFDHYFDFSFKCSVSPIVACAQDYPKPTEPFQREQIRAYLAAVAGIRYMLVLGGQHYYLMNAFTTVLIDIDDLVKSFTGSGSKPSATEHWNYISDALYIIGGALSVEAAVVAPEVFLPAVLAGIFGSLGGFAGVIDAAMDIKDIGPLDKDISGLKNYMADQGDVFLKLIENTGAAFLGSPVNASMILKNTSSYQWLNPTNEPIWEKPQLGVDASASMLKAWATSPIFQALGIFLHLETGCDHETMTQHLYDGQQCIGWSDDEIKIPDPTYVFPIYYIREDDFHSTRDYGLANNLKPSNFDNNPNFQWIDVAVGSMKCQYHFNTKNGFSSDAEFYLPFDATGLLDAMGSSGKSASSFDPRTVPCLWNMPVCSAADSNIVAACRSKQTCVTGHGSCDTCDIGASGAGFIDHTDDNFALDDWCAGKIGASNFEYRAFDYC